MTIQSSFNDKSCWHQDGNGFCQNPATTQIEMNTEAGLKIVSTCGNHYAPMKISKKNKPLFSNMLAAIATNNTAVFLLLIVSAFLGVEVLAQRKVITQWRHAQTELRRLRIQGMPLAHIAAQGSALVLEQENIVCVALDRPLRPRTIIKGP